MDRIDFSMLIILIQQESFIVHKIGGLKIV
ncbi:hypothetical protein P606_13230 [Comamonas thiooxydans]|nr:hypothetical protein P606_13230 [Comamonas thiooxydans]